MKPKWPVSSLCEWRWSSGLRLSCSRRWMFHLLWILESQLDISKVLHIKVIVKSSSELLHPLHHAKTAWCACSASLAKWKVQTSSSRRSKEFLPRYTCRTVRRFLKRRTSWGRASSPWQTACIVPQGHGVFRGEGVNTMFLRGCCENTKRCRMVLILLSSVASCRCICFCSFKCIYLICFLT